MNDLLLALGVARPIFVAPDEPFVPITCEDLRFPVVQIGPFDALRPVCPDWRWLPRWGLFGRSK